ncbi:AAA family ATPase [Sanguibacter sp. HDW7]|uniref:AAA family ATPase n=1 Tax=Sanguibacter sp. HDW7 TaxID=2714931 RepID=UPI0014091224|nr:AAA family ATPase [Sanguibacter sp. HDW7]QIK83847.1 AAA family ATPase [Sanguibacter sp. HDW7]
MTGVNSSGKSSMIQSLLLMTQSLYNDTSCVLNGPLVRLGDAQDLVREGATSGSTQFSIGFDPQFLDGGTHDRVRVDYELVATEDRSSLRARRVSVQSAAHSAHPLVLSQQNSRGSDVEQALQATHHLGQTEALHLKSLLGSEKLLLRTYVIHQGFRPVAVVQLMAPELVERRYASALEALLSGKYRSRSARISSGALPVAIRELSRLLSDAAANDPTKRSLAEQFHEVRNGNPYMFERIWNKLDLTLQAEAISTAAAQRKGRPFALLPIQGTLWGHGISPGVLEGSLEQKLGATYEVLRSINDILDRVAQRVQYLGPLRDEPRVVWNHWNELARGLPVGTRGEYSAAVLSRSGSNVVQYHPPEGGPTDATLSTAVNRWLTHLQIGEKVTARSRGKLGVGFDLRLGDSIRDLTSVGVGVSQALPLLVGLLSAPRGSIFIVEQPELHLHPAVQARLADFLLMARPDVALVVETHSEAFITRVRRRAAEGGIDVADVDIVFVEPHKTGSETRKLRLSEFGDLSEWPAGFLSSAEEDIRAILRMNIQRSSESHNNG